MDTHKIISLKQEQIPLETKKPELEKKISSKKVSRTMGWIGLLIGLLMCIIAGPVGIIVLLVALIVLVAGFIGTGKIKHQLSDINKRLEEIKIELIKEEHSV